MITVKQLKQVLENLPDDMPVLTDGYESDFDNVGGMFLSHFAMNVPYQPGYCGEHLICREESSDTTQCLYLPRYGAVSEFENDDYDTEKLTVEEDE